MRVLVVDDETRLVETLRADCKATGISSTRPVTAGPAFG